MSFERQAFDQKAVLVRKPSEREIKKVKTWKSDIKVRSALTANEGKSVSLNSGTSLAKSASMKVSLPPKLNTTVEFKHVYRYACRTGNTLSPVTGADLLLCCGAVALTATTAAGFTSSVKVHSIKIWTAPNATATDSAAVQWQSPIIAVEKDVYMDQSVPVGVTITGASVFTPPADTFCAKWLTNTSLAVFSITAPQGSLVDVCLSGTFSNALGSSVATAATGLTVGAVYYGALDGATTNSVFIAHGVPAL